MWKELSDELSAAAQSVAPRLVFIGGPEVSRRTGVLWKPGLVVTFARQAQEGEPVDVTWADGATETAVVKAWDSRTGLAVLTVSDSRTASWTKVARPPVGSLVLTVAAPSTGGIEARLDLVRFSGAQTEWASGVVVGGLLQTDGSEWPGFRGAAVVDSQQRLVGLVAENRSGNDGFIVLAEDLEPLVQALVEGGSVHRARLGVSTRSAGGQGLVLVDVESGSPAEVAGWREGDLLVSLAGKPLANPGDLVAVLKTLTPGISVPAKVLRAGEVHDWPVTPAART